MQPSSRPCSKFDFLGAIQESEFPFKDMDFDGILGLSPAFLGPGGLGFDLGFAAFAVRLGGEIAHSPSSSGDGEIAFFTGPFGPLSLAPLPASVPQWWPQAWTWAPMPSDATERDYWLVRLLSVTIGDSGLQVQICTPDSRPEVDGCRAVLDTGSGFMTGPEAAVGALLKALDLRDNCSEADSQRMPDVVFTIQGTGGPIKLAIKPSDYIDRFRARCALKFQSDGLPTGGGAPWVLGQPFLRRYLTAYDPPHLLDGSPGYVGFAPNCDWLWVEGCPSARSAEAPTAPHPTLLSEGDHANGMEGAITRGPGLSIAVERRVQLHSSEPQQVTLRR